MTMLRKRSFLYCSMMVLACTACSVEKVETPSPESTVVDDTANISSALNITTPLGVAMVSIPAGEFTMGDKEGEYDESPLRSVKISAFYMDVYEVSQESYTALMGQNTSKHKNPKNPVEQLGWFAAIKYCNMRSLRENLTPCYNVETMECDFSANGYRLPTEAEWEYACRAGSTTAYSFGASDSLLKNYAWYDLNSAKAPKPVGGKKPNVWGLYDMHGNVSEWCNDTYSDTFYAQSNGQDPNNSAVGDERVLRGGNWDSDEDTCRSSARYSEAPGLADVCFGYDAYGFRCVRRIDESSPDSP